MSNLKISIITVSYNSRNTIEQTIQSVISQNYKNFEYIIIDGGSSDGTIEIIKKYTNFITYWKSEKDKGIYYAMNKGISKSTGDVIAFLNSDDWYNDGTLSIVAEWFENESIEVLTGKINIVNGKSIKKHNYFLCNDKKNLRYCMIYSHPATFAKRELFDKYGLFNTNYKIAADYDWVLRIFNKGVSIKQIDAILTNFRNNGVSNIKIIDVAKETRQVAISSVDEIFNSEIIDKLEYEEIRYKIEMNYSNLINNYKGKLAIERKILYKNMSKLKFFKQKYFVSNLPYSIFGTGINGEECYSLLHQLKISIVCFWDNDPQKWNNKLLDIPIYNPLNIKEVQSCVIISSTIYESEIEEQLLNIGMVEGEDFILYSKIRGLLGEILMG